MCFSLSSLVYVALVLLLVVSVGGFRGRRNSVCGRRGRVLWCPAGHSRVAELARTKKKLLAEMLTEIADRGTRNLEVQLAWCCPATWGIVRAEMWTQKRQCCSLTADNGRKGREVNKSSVGNRSGPDRDGGVYGSKRCFSMFGCRCVSLSLPRPRQGGKQRARVCAAGHRRAGVDDVVFVGGSLEPRPALWGGENRKETRIKAARK